MILYLMCTRAILVPMERRNLEEKYIYNLLIVKMIYVIVIVPTCPLDRVMKIFPLFRKFHVYRFLFPGGGADSGKKNVCNIGMAVFRERSPASMTD